MERFIYGRYGLPRKDGSYQWYVRPISWAGIWKPVNENDKTFGHEGAVLIGGNTTALFDLEEWARDHCLQLNDAVKYKQIIEDTIKFIDDKCVEDEPVVIKEKMLEAMKGDN